MARYDSGIRYDSGARYDEPEPQRTPPPRHMSTQNLISGILSQADYDAIMAAFDTIITKLEPVAVDLSPEERQSLVKQGPKSMEFVNGIHTLAVQNPSAVPANIDMAEFTRDHTLCGQLATIDTKVTRVREIVGDSFMAVGSDCMNVALTNYRVMNAQRLGALDDNLRHLGRRFERVSRTLPAPTP